MWDTLCIVVSFVAGMLINKIFNYSVSLCKKIGWFYINILVSVSAETEIKIEIRFRNWRFLFEKPDIVVKKYIFMNV